MRLTTFALMILCLSARAAEDIETAYSTYVTDVLAVTHSIADREAHLRELATMKQKATFLKEGFENVVKLVPELEAQVARLPAEGLPFCPVRSDGTLDVIETSARLAVTTRLAELVGRVRQVAEGYRSVAGNLEASCAEPGAFQAYGEETLALFYFLPDFIFSERLAADVRRLDAGMLRTPRFREFARQACLAVAKAHRDQILSYEPLARQAAELVDLFSPDELEARRDALRDCFRRHEVEWLGRLREVALARARETGRAAREERAALRLSLEASGRIERNLHALQGVPCGEGGERVAEIRADLSVRELLTLSSDVLSPQIREWLGKRAQACPGEERKALSARRARSQLRLRGFRQEEPDVLPAYPPIAYLLTALTIGATSRESGPKEHGTVCVSIDHGGNWSCASDHDRSGSGRGGSGGSSLRGADGRDGGTSGRGEGMDGRDIRNWQRQVAEYRSSLEQLGPTAARHRDMKKGLRDLAVTSAVEKAFSSRLGSTRENARNRFAALFAMTPAVGAGGEVPQAEVSPDLIASKWVKAELSRVEASRRNPRELLGELERVEGVLEGRGESLDPADYQALRNVHRSYFDATGLLNEKALSREGAELSRSIGGTLRTDATSPEGRAVRSQINRGLVGLEAAGSEEARGEILGGLATLLGADAAFAEGSTADAEALLAMGAAITDTALGLTPLGPLIDAGHLISGIATGHDLTGKVMTAGDYTLRGIGALLGLTPVGNLLARGAAKGVKVAKTWITGAFVRAANLLRNSKTGAAVARLLKTERAGITLGTFMERLVIGERKITFLTPQLQEKLMEHGPTFGVDAKNNRKNIERFRAALTDHINSPQTLAIRGTYRSTIPAIHYFDPRTGRYVVVKDTGEFISGWNLSKEQAFNLLERGNVQ